MTEEISIGQVKRDISDLVNRVAYKGERIILTSRGHPKAALVSIGDFEKLQQVELGMDTRSAWLVEARALAERIRSRRDGQPIDVDALLEADRVDRDERND